MKKYVLSALLVVMLLGSLILLTACGSNELVGKWESMVQVTELPNCWVDCSAMPDMFDAEGWPYPTAHKILKKVISVAGIDSIIWGSDITGTLNRATYPQMIDMFRRTDFLSEEDLDKIFYQNAKVAYRI